MNDLISVIIPVYNVEKYIRECFDSLLKQTYSNFEAIVIDDGSTDQSGNICDEYAKKDARFRVFHSENLGASSARNFGIQKMNGDYVFFLDSDDILVKGSLRYLIDLIKRTNTDIAISSMVRFSGAYEEFDQKTPIETEYDGHKCICENVLICRNDFKLFTQQKSDDFINSCIWCSCLYKSELLKTHQIHFLPLTYWEDTYIFYKYLLNARNCVTSTKITYAYRKNPFSTTFRYNPRYLIETKEYYKSYLSLFEDYAPEYFSRAKTGLDGQYLNRCLSLIERELTISSNHHTIREKLQVIHTVCKDKKFCELFTWANIKCTPNGIMRYMLYSVKLRIYPLTVPVFCLVYKQTRQRHRA